MVNYVRQFIKIGVVFHTLYIWNEDGDPQFFRISGTSNSLSDCSKIFKKIYRVENFRANVLKVPAVWTFSSPEHTILLTCGRDRELWLDPILWVCAEYSSRILS